ncbi:MAG: DUF2147 domain-containing protein [Litorimonas sp.]
MQKLTKSLVLGAALLGSAFNAQAVTSSAPSALTCGTSIYGSWVTNKGNSVVNISDCGLSGICGDVLKFANDAKYDELTPETAVPLQGVKGARVLNEFHPKSEKKFQGRIFNPRNGKNYKSTLKVSKTGDLKVKGCLGPICETKIWVRPEVCNS